MYNLINETYKQIGINTTTQKIKLYIRYALQTFINNWIPPSTLKNKLLRLLGYKIKPTVFISPQVILDPIKPEFIEIDDNVFIGWNVRIFIHQIDYKNNKITCKLMPVKIGKNTLIGGFSTIRPGVSIGQNCIIASDTLVNKNVPDNHIAIGIPARIKPIETLQNTK